MIDWHRPKYQVRRLSPCCALPTVRLRASTGTHRVSNQELRPVAMAHKQPASCTDKQEKPVVCQLGLPKSKSLKRSRSVAQGLALARQTDVTNEDVNEFDQANVDNLSAQVVNEESHTFYIGDIGAFKEFLYYRFDELTMKPLRGIVTHWVKLLEPK